MLRLTQQKVHVLGHDHVSDDDELVTEADLFQELQEEIAALRSSQQLWPMVSTEGDEMKISGAIVAM